MPIYLSENGKNNKLKMLENNLKIIIYTTFKNSIWPAHISVVVKYFWKNPLCLDAHSTLTADAPRAPAQAPRWVQPARPRLQLLVLRWVQAQRGRRPLAPRPALPRGAAHRPSGLPRLRPPAAPRAPRAAWRPQAHVAPLPPRAPPPQARVRLQALRRRPLPPGAAGPAPRPAGARRWRAGPPPAGASPIPTRPPGTSSIFTIFVFLEFHH